MWVDEEPGAGERLLWLAVLPLVGAIGFGVGVPSHPDYLGHYLAGAGGSLLAVWIAARAGGGRPWVTVAATLACIGLGAFAEASLFALAGFDPIDFGSQSIGATLAGLALLHGRAGHPNVDTPDGASPLVRNAYGRQVFCLGTAGLVAGTLFAFA